MNRRTFLKSLLGLGAAVLPLPVIGHQVMVDDSPPLSGRDDLVYAPPGFDGADSLGLDWNRGIYISGEFTNTDSSPMYYPLVRWNGGVYPVE